MGADLLKNRAMFENRQNGGYIKQPIVGYLLVNV